MTKQSCCLPPQGGGILIPKTGWKERRWYIVEASFSSHNPIHRYLYYTGFLNGRPGFHGWPGGYNFFPDTSGKYTICDCYYMKPLMVLPDHNASVLETESEMILDWVSDKDKNAWRKIRKG